MLQTQHGNQQIIGTRLYRGPIDCLNRVVKEQGILSLWRGNFANILRYFPSQALSFAFKDQYRSFFGESSNKVFFY